MKVAVHERCLRIDDNSIHIVIITHTAVCERESL